MSVGSKLKDLREERKISLEDLAERTGLKTEDITLIEESDLIPGLSPLVKIARVMGVRLGTFMDDCENIGPVISRSGERSQTTRFGKKNGADHGDLSFHSLAPNKAGRHMEPFIIEIEPSSATDIKLSSHEGEEFIFVMEGSVEIDYGKDKISLARGDSIYYDSAVPHHVHSNSPATILAVVYSPF
jgi:transcriptional regulator with XRE-family HTH domain